MSFENANGELSMETMELINQSVLSEKKESKSLTMNEKRSLYGILSFLVIANRDGVLDDTKTQELMELLPLFQTVSEKKAFLSQEMFDVKKTEKEILKPMVLEHNRKLKLEKKQEEKAAKKEQKKKEASVDGEKEEPKKRVSKKKAVATEGEEEAVVEEVVSEKTLEKPKKKVSKKKAVAEVVIEEAAVVEEAVVVSEEVVSEEVVSEKVEEKPKKKVSKKKSEKVAIEEVTEATEEVVEEKKKETKKRGRKAKEQIVECNTELNLNAGNSQEDQLADLVSQLTAPTKLTLQNPNDIEMSDLDEVLSNLEEGEVMEKAATPVLPEKKVKAPKKKAAPKK